VCGTYFVETSGTVFYRSPLPPDKLCQIIAVLAEGLTLQSTARVFEADVDTVKSCLTQAAAHMDAVSNYLIHDLHLTQVQVDELWAVVQSWGEEHDTAEYGPAPKPRWTPLPALHYAQVVKRRVKGRVVKVTQRVVFGCAETITATLKSAGRKACPERSRRVNTAFPLTPHAD
jgi:hypothetical protein